LYAGLTNGVYKSTDNGATWSNMFSGMPSYTAVNVFSYYNGNLYAGSAANGIFNTASNGAGWKSLNQNFPKVYNVYTPDSLYTGINSFSFSSSNLFLGTDSGVISRPIAEVVSNDKVKQNAPSNYSLEQNYPNPFNPETIISYSLPAGCYVSLKVFDLLGHEVAALVSEYQGAGSHKIKFDTANRNLTSGVYFYLLTTPNYSAVKKLVLLK